MFGAGRPENQPADDGPEGSGNGAGDQGSQTKNQTKKETRLSKKVIAIGAAAAAVAVGGGAYALTQAGGSSPTASHKPAAAKATGPISVKSVSPAAGAGHVDGTAPITVSFSGPVAANTPDPTLSPAVEGSWTPEGNTLVFTPVVPFPPSTHVTVDVQAGLDGVRGANGSLLTTGMTRHFTTSSYSQLRLAQLLGQLGYLPASWAPAEGGAARGEFIGADAASMTQAGLAYDPPAGNFQWDSGYPSSLRSQWSSNQPNVVVRGAVMAFQSEHGMPITGDVNQHLWKRLFQAVERGDQNPNGYTYAVASKSSPETLTIWHDGHVVLRSLTNTGIPVAPTVDGTFPVYLRFRNTIMSGTNPDGSHYSDPVSFVSYFNGGDAVHYFPRGSYGFQQSLGCVELPYTSAQRAFPYLTYGSLVSVTG